MGREEGGWGGGGIERKRWGGREEEGWGWG